jgi:hypothetical protein
MSARWQGMEDATRRAVHQQCWQLHEQPLSHLLERAQAPSAPDGCSAIVPLQQAILARSWQPEVLPSTAVRCFFWRGLTWSSIMHAPGQHPHALPGAAPGRPLHARLLAACVLPCCMLVPCLPRCCHPGPDLPPATRSGRRGRPRLGAARWHRA